MADIQITAVLVLCILAAIPLKVSKADESNYYDDEDDESGEETVTSKKIRIMEQDKTIENYDDLLRRIGNFTEPSEIKRHSNEELLQKIEQLNMDYPNLTYVYEIGKSVQGRPLTVIAIGKYPREHRAGIPEFKYVGNMHGNEISGREVLLLLAEVLITNYGKNKVLSHLMDNTRIHLLLSMNPDGFTQAIAGTDAVAWIQGRNNADGHDLNRVFPARKLLHSTISTPEANAVMNWTRSIPFVLSAALHDGTEVVNFPYDSNWDVSVLESLTPDHDLFIFISYSYARAHKTMWKKGSRCQGRDFAVQEGITNGYSWYPIEGSMQDWNYIFTNCFEITIEMSCIKYVDATGIKKVWDDHKFALISFIEKVHQTIHGFVLNSATGKGISGIEILIDNNSKVVKTNKNGEYWRLILPGNYTVIFQHACYKTVTKQVVVTKESRSAYLNVSMNDLQKSTENTQKRIRKSSRINKCLF